MVRAEYALLTLDGAPVLHSALYERRRVVGRLKCVLAVLAMATIASSPSRAECEDLRF